MKKILFGFVFFICLKSFGQYPVKQTLGSDSTLVESRGSMKSRFINRVFTDTTQANTQRIKHYDGAQVYTNSGGGELWIRDSTLNKWVAVGRTIGTPTKFAFYNPTSGKLDIAENFIYKASPNNRFPFGSQTTLNEGTVTLNAQNYSELGIVTKLADFGAVSNDIYNLYEQGVNPPGSTQDYSAASASLTIAAVNSTQAINLIPLAGFKGNTIADSAVGIFYNGKGLNIASNGNTGYVKFKNSYTGTPYAIFEEGTNFLGLAVADPAYRLHVDDPVKLSGTILNREDEFGGPTIRTNEYLTITSPGVNLQTRNLTQFQALTNDHPVELRLMGGNGSSMAGGVGVINGYNYDGPQLNQPLRIITSGFNPTITHKGGSIYLIPGTNYTNVARDYTFNQYTGDSVVVKLNTDAAYRPYFYVRGRQHTTDSSKHDDVAYYTQNIHGKFFGHSFICKDYFDSVVATIGGGGGGVTTMAAIGSSPNANGATITGSTLNLEPYSALFGGVTTTGAQTSAGRKTFGAQAKFDAGFSVAGNYAANEGFMIGYDAGSNMATLIAYDGGYKDIRVISNVLTLYGGGSNPGLLINGSGNTIVGSTTAADAVAKFNVRSTTEQLRLQYDASNYSSETVASDGSTQFDAVGSAPSFSFKDAVNIITTSSGVIGVGGIYHTNVTDVGNVGAGEDDLMTKSVDAGLLAADKEFLEFTATFTVTDNVTIKTFFGATQLVSFAGTSANSNYHITGRIFRTGAATQKAVGEVYAGTTFIGAFRALPTETLSGAVTFKYTGEGDTNNDVVQTTSTIKWFPAK